MSFPVTKAMRAERRKRAEARQAEYDKLSLQQKLDKLPPAPQASKQRSKLTALLEKQKEKQNLKVSEATLKEMSDDEENVIKKYSSKKKGRSQ